MPRGTLKYWVGYLAADKARNPALREMAAKMMLLSDKGEMRLVQRKLMEGVYEYLAVPVRERYDDAYGF
jgi:hypothetical protein